MVSMRNSVPKPNDLMPGTFGNAVESLSSFSEVGAILSNDLQSQHDRILHHGEQETPAA